MFPYSWYSSRAKPSDRISGLSLYLSLSYYPTFTLSLLKGKTFGPDIRPLLYPITVGHQIQFFGLISDELYMLNSAGYLVRCSVGGRISLCFSFTLFLSLAMSISSLPHTDTLSFTYAHWNFHSLVTLTRTHNHTLTYTFSLTSS